ncbi:hypothetical protein SPRG_02874 [Saprolegnia parasitica CBS 223.65]|uniref:Uncharacterized protein n=1 Tax=Saprolegnia parasitica (strain CBS 223.65) TaxID=695850 RepID=A0A067D020_SAPPC|nr:hypothetical protein SPRG_02874 [Saprolegnia parasitica CBS 223.65]KDO32397.1 hypothetical protein SPRG_02874 [Saprolegnia parasitica CBS 223.65]|eukprot:XP_012196851.1 hypothetical protein SPRG_02874 [Saprolegnia parasitica CBS 223.65]
MSLARAVRLARPLKRAFSTSPPPGASAADNSSFFQILGMASVIGGVAYVYRDPDVLPHAVKQFLPIQEPQGKSMTLEEYEVWRAKQGVPSGATVITSTKKQSVIDDEPVAAAAEDVPVVAAEPAVNRESLLKALDEAREQEASFLSELKANRTKPTDEEREMLQVFKSEKARLKKQLKAFPPQK